MKFWFELVPCFVSQQSHPSDAAERPWTEGTGSYMRLPRLKKRGAVVGPPGNAVAAEWKPSLSSISEDRAVTVKPENGNPAADTGERQVRRKSGGGGSQSRVHDRGGSHNFGRDPYETAIPAFSPTPFTL